MSEDRIPLDVLKRFANKKTPSATTVLFHLMRETNNSYHDLMDMPIPAILILWDELVQFKEEEHKQMKKSTKGKR